MSWLVSNESCGSSSTPSSRVDLGEDFSLFSEEELSDVFFSDPAQRYSPTRKDATVEKTNQVLENFSFPHFEDAATPSQSKAAEDFESIDNLGGDVFVYSNGDEFRGIIRNGLPNGFGELTFQKDKSWIMGTFENGSAKQIFKAGFFDENGSRYEGDVLDGRPHGIGRKIFKNGNWIESEYNHGLLIKELRGRIFLTKDVPYEGEVLNGKPHGRGRKIYKNGGWIEVEFKLGCLVKELRAQFFLPGGSYYEGEVLNGKPHGMGKKVFKKGDWIEGRFEAGRCKEGRGRISLPGGHIYEGEIVNDKPHGMGKKVYKNGDWMEGRFEMGFCKEGRGHFFFHQTQYGNWGYEYEGAIINEKPHGIGRKILVPGIWTEGEFEQGALIKELKGRIRLCDQIFYEGEILDEKAHGNGTVSNEGRPIFKGKFKHGDLTEVLEAIEAEEVLSVVNFVIQEKEKRPKVVRSYNPIAKKNKEPQEISFLDGPLAPEDFDLPFENEEMRSSLPPEKPDFFVETSERPWEMSFLQTPQPPKDQDLSFEKEEMSFSDLFSPASGEFPREDLFDTPNFLEFFDESENEENSLGESSKRKREGSFLSANMENPQKRSRDSLSMDSF